MVKSKILKNSFLNLLSIGIYAGVQWWILSFMAHSHELEQIGFYSYALSVITPIAVFANLNLRYIYVSDNNNQFQFIHYWALRVTLFLLSAFFVLLFILFAHKSLIVSLLICGIFIYKAFESFSDMFFACHHKAEENQKISKSIIIRSGLIFLSFTLSFYFFKSILLSLLFIVVSYIFSFLSVDKKTLPEKIKKEISPLLGFYSFLKNKDFQNQLKKLFNLGLPMGIGSLIYSLIVVVPRFFIDSYIGVDSLGIFSAIYYLFTALLLVSIAFADASIPRFVKFYHEGNIASFKRLMLVYQFSIIVIFLLVCLTVYYFGDEILKLAYGNNFGHFKMLFLYGLIVTAIEVMSKFAFTGLTSLRILKHQAVIQVLTLIIITSSCYFFRKDITLEKIVFYQGIAFGFQLIAALFFLNYGLKKNIVA